MSKREFKVGDRVVFEKYCSGECYKGGAGVITHLNSRGFAKVLMNSGYQSGDLKAEAYLELKKPQHPNPPHKHAELIKAWADGAEIQCKHWRDDRWLDLNVAPVWGEKYSYRIKPATDNTKEISSIRKEMEELSKRLKDLEV